MNVNELVELMNICHVSPLSPKQDKITFCNELPKVDAVVSALILFNCAFELYNGVESHPEEKRIYLFKGDIIINKVVLYGATEIGGLTDYEFNEVWKTIEDYYYWFTNMPDAGCDVYDDYDYMTKEELQWIYYPISNRAK